MQLVYADQPIPSEIRKSLFLAGPSPRDPNVTDWRHEALTLLEAIGYDGTVFLPIPQGRFHGEHDAAEWTYDGQVQWECDARAVADKLVFWLPRSIEGKMPGFTTNVEFGEDLGSGKMLYGRPDSAEKCRYLDKRVQSSGMTVFDNLQDLLQATAAELGDGAFRTGGEVQVPLFIWNSAPFQDWYKNLKQAGNRLDGASLLNHFMIKGSVWSFTLAVNVWVESEKRHKANEFIYSRPNVSSVVAFYRPGAGKPPRVVMVREFRSTVNNPSGYVMELPSGSHLGQGTLDAVMMKVNAQDELREETGIQIDDLSRFILIDQRQVNATVGTHTASLYSVELNKTEYERAMKAVMLGLVNGQEEDGERTQMVIVPWDSIEEFEVDMATLGMVWQALHKLD